MPSTSPWVRSPMPTRSSTNTAILISSDLLQHTAYDEFWRSRSLEPHLHDIQPAVLAVGGWFDAEDLQGPLRLYRNASTRQPHSPVALVMGPWVHGAWHGDESDHLGPVQFGQQTSKFFEDSIEAPFFEKWLRDGEDPQLPAAWDVRDRRQPLASIRRLAAGRPRIAEPSICARAARWLSIRRRSPKVSTSTSATRPRPVPFTSFTPSEWPRNIWWMTSALPPAGLTFWSTRPRRSTPTSRWLDPSACASTPPPPAGTQTGS